MSGCLGNEKEKEKGTERDSIGQEGHEHGVWLEYSRSPGWEWLATPGRDTRVPRLLSGPCLDNHGRPEGNWVSDRSLGRIGSCTLCVSSPWGPLALCLPQFLPRPHPLSLPPISPHTHSQRASLTELYTLLPSKPSSTP